MTLQVADRFSRYPAGRDQNDGPFNGTAFRTVHLVPALNEAKKSGRKLNVSFEGVISYGSSFLEEAFGGLVRIERFKKSDLRKTLTITNTSPYSDRYERAIWRYIDNA
ncbi:STAS-like domain-containing protein [Loktanella sp. 3ANDIMAR09]|uniref:STAS-like domain-containing protein n=1 Tax=Loktanella sp. 3ANDIMAR09 TaxID=1225657 RepID=UPI0009FA2F33